MAVVCGLFVALHSLFLPVEFLHIVGWKHSSLTCLFHCSHHPAVIDRIALNNDVILLEANLIIISGGVIVQRLRHILWDGQETD